MNSESISEIVTIPSKRIEVNGSSMHYLEQGEGNPILFLHGLPMSSYVWRNVIPHLSSLGRCIAPDLIGFGQSDKPDIPYTIADHINYIEAFISALNLTNITLVMHGWGSVIGFDYAMRNEKNCKGLVFYEAFLRSKNKDDLSLPYQEQWIALQEQKNVYDLDETGAVFIEKFLPQTLIRSLTDVELEAYRAPFVAAGSGKPILQFLKELPNGEGKSEVDAIISRYSKQLTLSKLPKLMLYSVPGFITTIATAMWAKDNLPDLEIVEIGEDLHLAQESYPKLIGDTISVWLQSVEQMHV
jgi:haloalkane dehalogenase